MPPTAKPLRPSLDLEEANRRYRAILANERGNDKAAPKRRGKNKLEEAFGRHLEYLRTNREIVWFAFEPMRFRLAEGAWYKPDYFVERADGQLVCYECKGFWREASRVRIKVAAELHPRFAFVAVQRIKGEWVYEEFSGRE